MRKLLGYLALVLGLGGLIALGAGAVAWALSWFGTDFGLVFSVLALGALAALVEVWLLFVGSVWSMGKTVGEVVESNRGEKEVRSWLASGSGSMFRGRADEEGAEGREFSPLGFDSSRGPKRS